MVVNIGMRRGERQHKKFLAAEKAKEIEMEEMKKLLREEKVMSEDEMDMGQVEKVEKVEKAEKGVQTEKSERGVQTD